MGCADSKGLIPRLCDALFERIAISSGPNSDCNDSKISHKVEVSYMEIYNEKVRLVNSLLMNSHKFFKCN